MTWNTGESRFEHSCSQIPNMCFLYLIELVWKQLSKLRRTEMNIAAIYHTKLNFSLQWISPEPLAGTYTSRYTQADTRHKRKHTNTHWEDERADVFALSCRTFSHCMWVCVFSRGCIAYISCHFLESFSTGQRYTNTHTRRTHTLERELFSVHFAFLFHCLLLLNIDLICLQAASVVKQHPFLMLIVLMKDNDNECVCVCVVTVNKCMHTSFVNVLCVTLCTLLANESRC